MAPGVAQRVGQQRAVRPGAHAARRQAHRAGLRQPRGVQFGGLRLAQPPGQRQLPGAGGSKKGGELCFHILAAFCGQPQRFQGLDRFL